MSQRSNLTNPRWNGNLDIIVASGELKKILIQRSKDLGVDFKSVCQKVGFSYEAFSKHYLQQNSPRPTSSFKQKHLVMIAGELGIDVRVAIVIKKVNDNVRRDKET